MFEYERPKSKLRSVFSMLALIYHSVVRDVRKQHRHAMIGLIASIFQNMLLIVAFYFMMSYTGARSMGIRGDFLLYVMTGIFMFMTHSKAIAAVLKADGPASAMMNHAPLNTTITITSSALSALYIQILSMTVLLYLYHIIMGPIQIYEPAGAFAMVLLSWFSGVAIGIIFLSIRPFAPTFVNIIAQVYSRANMIASGKMFVANALPAYMLAMFDWNPLFHTIDQARGFTFINYNPHHSSVEYPIKISLILIVIGLMLEFSTRQKVSRSWDAAR